MSIALALTDALDHLHKNGLVHRDIKPSNIIFVRAKAKFADIGLVTGIGDSATFVGTEGYVPPEGPGKPLADIYSLGKVFYEASTGQSLRHFPELPTLMAQGADPRLKMLLGVILSACQLNPAKRLPSAARMHAELLKIMQRDRIAGRPSPMPDAAGAPPGGVQFTRRTSEDNERLPDEIAFALPTPASSGIAKAPIPLETVGGAVPLDSAFYIVRAADAEFKAAIARNDSIVLVKGARQMGKTSLLARSLQEAREEGVAVLLTDFQKLNAGAFESLENFYLALSESVADQLDLDAYPSDGWDRRRSPNSNFERYLRRELLERLVGRVVWGLDEVDRLFPCGFSNEVFGLFRSWHNKRALEPGGPWAALTLAMAYATEAHLFITDLVQSPFNIGTRLTLGDFSPDQVAELNRRYGSPLPTAEAVARFVRLLGGQPFLVRRGLHELAAHNPGMDQFEVQASQDEGIFGDHLRRILFALAKDPSLADVARKLLQGIGSPPLDAFYRLRSSGVIVGESPREARPRCGLYELYLKRHLPGL